MRASHAIEEAIHQRAVRTEQRPIELFFEWSTEPGWGLLRSVTAMRALLSDVFACPVELIASGPGCFFARYALSMTQDRFEEAMAVGAREHLQELMRRFDVTRLRVQTLRRKATVFA